MRVKFNEFFQISGDPSENEFNHVAYKPQNKSEKEKAQARANIGADKPFALSELGDTIRWNGDEFGLEACSFPVWLLVHELTDEDVAAFRENPELLKQAKGMDRDGTERLYWQTRGEAVEFDRDSIVVILENNYDMENMGKFIFPKRGVYFYKGGQSNSGGTFDVQTASFTVPGYKFKGERMKENWLPRLVVQNGDDKLILRSPKGYYFELTVSNSGELSTKQIYTQHL